MLDPQYKHRTAQLTIQTRIPEWARWFTVDEDGSIRVWRFKPRNPGPNGSDLWWSPKDEEHLGVEVLNSYGDIQGDGAEIHCPGVPPRNSWFYWKIHPRVKNWRELVSRIKQADFR